MVGISLKRWLGLSALILFAWGCTSADKVVRRYNPPAEVSAFCWPAMMDWPDSHLDYIWDMVADECGNIYFVGAVDSDKMMNWLVGKYDWEGNLLWVKEYGAQGMADQAWTIAIDSQKNVYAAGFSQTDNSAYYNGHLRKYDKDGNELWNVFYEQPSGIYARIHDVKIDSEGYVITCGYVTDEGGVNWYTTWRTEKRRPEDGSLIWSRAYGTYGPPATTDKAHALALSPEDDIYVGGTEGQYDVRWTAVVKYNKRGDVVWVWSDPEKVHGRVLSMAADGKGGVYLAGDLDSKFAVNRIIDLGGRAVKAPGAWPVIIPGSRGIAYGAAVEGRGNVIAGGFLEAATRNWHAASYDPQGMPAWDSPITYDSGNDDELKSVIFDSCGNLLAGGFAGSDARMAKFGSDAACKCEGKRFAGSR